MVELLTYDDMTKEELGSELFEDIDEDSSVGGSVEQAGAVGLQIIVQRNDFLLPMLIDMLKTHKTLELSPDYQRRSRWDTARKSRLIESFLVNIPVPPIFLYENEFAKYEVMDGQQRVTAILEYFGNQFALRGLEILNGLVGKRFHQLPTDYRSRLERRTLSTIILLKESTPSPEATALLRRYVFQRLNTGGVRLNAQEVRNSVWAGRFNELLLELSSHTLFTRMWGIPPHPLDKSVGPNATLQRNSLYRQMRDVELVLRVFGLLDPDNIGGGMRSTLDNAMVKYSEASKEELNELKTRFSRALELVHAIGGQDALRLPRLDSKRGRPSAPLFDSLMVALMRKLDHADQIQAHAAKINKAIQSKLENPEFYELIVARANTRSATLERSGHIEQLIESVIGN